MGEQLLNRKIYKEVKKMDRQEMELFVKKIYEKGFKDGFKEGTEAAVNTDFKIKFSEVLIRTKGVGPKLYDRIMDAAKEMEGNHGDK